MKKKGSFLVEGVYEGNLRTINKLILERLTYLSAGPGQSFMVTQVKGQFIQPVKRGGKK